MYTREITVMPSDASANGIIKLRNFLDYLQDTASMAVEDIEGNTTQLMARGYAWILTRYEIEFTENSKGSYAMPTLDEKFKITTYHDPNHGYGTLRVFKVHKLKNNGDKGDLIAWAKTSWLLLDLAAGRPVKPIEHLPEITRRDTENISPDFREIPDLKILKNLNLNELENNINLINVPCEIRYHDLDINGHANNAAYFEWIFEASQNIPDFDLMKYNLKSVSAFFRSGVKWGEKIRILIAEDLRPYGFGRKVEDLRACGIARKVGEPPFEFSELDNANNSDSDKLRSFVYYIVNDKVSLKPEKPTTFFCVWERKV